MTFMIRSTFGDDVQELVLPEPSFACLVGVLFSVHGLKELLAIKYRDDEGDWVTLRNDADVKEALYVCGDVLTLKLTGTAMPPAEAAALPPNSAETADASASSSGSGSSSDSSSESSSSEWSEVEMGGKEQGVASEVEQLPPALPISPAVNTAIAAAIDPSVLAAFGITLTPAETLDMLHELRIHPRKLVLLGALPAPVLVATSLIGQAEAAALEEMRTTIAAAMEGVGGGEGGSGAARLSLLARWRIVHGRRRGTSAAATPILAAAPDGCEQMEKQRLPNVVRRLIAKLDKAVSGRGGRYATPPPPSPVNIQQLTLLLLALPLPPRRIAAILVARRLLRPGGAEKWRRKLGRWGRRLAGKRARAQQRSSGAGAAATAPSSEQDGAAAAAARRGDEERAAAVGERVAKLQRKADELGGKLARVHAALAQLGVAVVAAPAAPPTSPFPATAAAVPLPAEQQQQARWHGGGGRGGGGGGRRGGGRGRGRHAQWAAAAAGCGEAGVDAAAAEGGGGWRGWWAERHGGGGGRGRGRWAAAAAP